MRHHVLSVSGGTVSGVEAVGEEGRIWGVSITPDSLDPVTVEIEPDLECELPGAICTADGRRLFNRMVLTVEPVEHHPATGAPTIVGTVEVGETLTVDTSGISDADGLTNVSYSYQWVSYDGNSYTDIQGATDSTYTLVPADEGKAFKVRVSFTDDAGFRESLTSELAHSERPYGLAATELDGAVVLTWKIPVGTDKRSAFQILRNRPELGETEPLVHVEYTQGHATYYTDTDVEPGVLYVYRVKGADFFGLRRAGVRPGVDTRSEAPTAQRRGAPAIIGTAQVGETLTADTSGISDADGLTNATITYQWMADDSDIVGATVSTYTLGAGDEGRAVRVRVLFTDDAGNEETVNSEPTAIVSAAPMPLTDTSRPNVVLILADDLGWGDIRSNNPDSSMTTPNIDGIAAAGVKFNDAHSPSSVCSPTRYGLLTGRYAWRTWLPRGTLSVHDRPLIGHGRPTLGTLLQGHRYRTAAVGKWHLGMDFARLTDIDAVDEINRGVDFEAEILDGPLDHGFDEFFGTATNLNRGARIYISDRRFVAHPDRDPRSDPGFFEFDEVLDRLTVEAVDFIERTAPTSDPFFLYLPLHTPHVPLVPAGTSTGRQGSATMPTLWRRWIGRSARFWTRSTGWGPATTRW